MKKPQPDLGEMLRSRFVQSMGGIRKLRRLWGTTTVDGVEVLTQRQYYHPYHKRMGYVPPAEGEEKVKVPKEFEKLVNYLGIYEDTVNGSTKGLDSAWLYFNKNNAKNQLTNPQEFVQQNLNKVFWDPTDGDIPSDLKLTTTLVIEGKIDHKRYLYSADEALQAVPVTSLLSPSMTNEERVQIVQDRYEELWDECVITQQGVGVIHKGVITDPVTKVETPDEDDLSPDDPWLFVLARNALRESSVGAIVKDVELGIRQHYRPGVQARSVVDPALYTSYVVTLEIPAQTFGLQHVLVSKIANDIDIEYDVKHHYLGNSNGYYTQKALKRADSSDLEDDPAIKVRQYTAWEDNTLPEDPRFDAIWFDYQMEVPSFPNGTRTVKLRYLRSDVFTNPRTYGLTFNELSRYLSKLVDTGYKKKKVKWYKKVIAFIVFVVSFIYGAVDGGLSMSWAAAILFASTVLAVLTIVFAAAGMNEWASAFAQANKDLAPIVMVAGVYLMVSSWQTVISEKGVETVVKEAVVDQVDKVIQEIVTGATDMAAGKITSASVSFTGRLVELVSMPMKNKLKSLNARNKDLKAEYDQLAQEMAQEHDVLRGFMNIYARPATADWSEYAAIFDIPYERGGGPLALGNVQRTAVQALRKADYDDPIFAGIRGV